MNRILECKEPLHRHHDGCPACDTRSYMCNNCGGGFNRREMKFTEDYDICNSCYEHELVCDCEGEICKLECNHCDLDNIQELIYNKKKGKIMTIMNKITSTFNQTIDILANAIGQIMDFYEWLLFENNAKGLKILTAWMSLGLLFALIELWTRSL